MPVQRLNLARPFKPLHNWVERWLIIGLLFCYENKSKIFAFDPNADTLNARKCPDYVNYHPIRFSTILSSYNYKAKPAARRGRKATDLRFLREAMDDSPKYPKIAGLPDLYSALVQNEGGGDREVERLSIERG